MLKASARNCRFSFSLSLNCRCSAMSCCHIPSPRDNISSQISELPRPRNRECSGVYLSTTREAGAVDVKWLTRDDIGTYAGQAAIGRIDYLARNKIER